MPASEFESTKAKPLAAVDLATVATSSNHPSSTTGTATATATATANATVPSTWSVDPSFQDIDSDTDSEVEPHDDDDWQAIMDAAEAAFSDDQVDEMISYLKENGLFNFVNRYVDQEHIPIPKLLLVFGILIPPHVDRIHDQLRLLKIAASRVLRNRDRLEQYSTVDDVVELIRKSKNIMVLTGAGVSTSCGIPDFRSPTGLYARLKEEHWELDDPQQMFDLDYFKEKPNVFYSFAKEIYPSNFTPSPCHRFVKVLEDNDKLLRNYTQNIDGLFERTGVRKMLNCHGSFATASCLRCRTQFPGSAIEADVFASRVPLCPHCTASDEQAAQAAATAAAQLTTLSKNAKKKKTKSSNAWQSDASDGSQDDDDGLDRSEWFNKPLIKPDIVFFGEPLPSTFDRSLLLDREQVDLLIVIGTSLRVSPVATIVSHLPHSVPQVLINRDPITHANFDVVLLGDGDTIVRHLCERLGKAFELGGGVGIGGGGGGVQDEGEGMEGPERVAESHVWLFKGSDRESRFVKMVRQAYEDDGDDEEEDGQGEGEGEGEEERRSSEGQDRSETREEGREEEQSTLVTAGDLVRSKNLDSFDDEVLENATPDVMQDPNGKPQPRRSRSPPSDPAEEAASKRVKVG
ncbi:BZ3500_MvSof-1268-A1-R1_Chr2-2g04941 [Microbotryum saponariae]|uniref:BZ3500_MvSof-1268-A1-R1_Chr2-2g04941 protein n=1 Tax=Microbotryum saponariae TaxID=289078 RepID=A0A2X0N5R0_9BASI|nr:BZ3500_MvSof-1268-A1-R1_Chr2-2g04941 [Microbotryum saponariae]SDA00526.1 BZ3501_MvSof-1269-A2-R1_Chr2-2g04615 [Microbotryum saponariae]